MTRRRGADDDRLGDAERGGALEPTGDGLEVEDVVRMVEAVGFGNILGKGDEAGEKWEQLNISKLF